MKKTIFGNQASHFADNDQNAVIEWDDRLMNTLFRSRDDATAVGASDRDTRLDYVIQNTKRSVPVHRLVKLISQNKTRVLGVTYWKE